MKKEKKRKKQKKKKTEYLKFESVAQAKHNNGDKNDNFWHQPSTYITYDEHGVASM